METMVMFKTEESFASQLRSFSGSMKGKRIEFLGFWGEGITLFSPLFT